jgi:hypothetical protein
VEECMGVWVDRFYKFGRVTSGLMWFVYIYWHINLSRYESLFVREANCMAASQTIGTTHLWFDTDFSI